MPTPTYQEVSQLPSFNSIRLNDQLVAIRNGALQAGLTTFDGSFLDSAGSKLLQLTEATIPVNYLSISNASTGNAVQLKSLGTDTNVVLELRPLGTSPVLFSVTGGNLQVNSGNSYSYQTTLAFPTSSGSGTLTFPNTTGTLTALGNSVTGSGSIVLTTSPTLVTPNIGVATASSINGLSITTSTGTLTVSNSKILTCSNSLTFTGTDSSSVNFTTGGTVLYSGGSISVNSINSLTITTSTGTLTIANGKTLTCSNTLTFTGTDSSSIAFGAGGTVVYTSNTSTTPTANTIAKWDASSNLSANNLLDGFQSVVSSAVTPITLTVASPNTTTITGSATQSITMPAVNTLVLGTTYCFINLSSNTTTVSSSGANTIQAMAPNTVLYLQSNATSGTSAAVWNINSYLPASSGITGSGNLVRATAPTLSQLSFNSTSGIIASGTNDSAPSGSVGYFVQSQVLQASGVSLTNSTSANITSISVPAGDWDISGIAVITFATSAGSNAYGWISSSSATLPDFSLLSGIAPAATSLVISQPNGFVVVPQRFSFSSTTTVYLSANAQFGGTAKASGFIIARLRR